MTPAALAGLHARAMRHASPWTAEAFASTLAAPGIFLLTSPPTSSPTPRREDADSVSADQPQGAVLGRVVEDEAELLTLVVEPGAQRGGVGRSLLAAFEAEAAARGARKAFLEASEDNIPALALYRGAGWRKAGRRRGYYHRPGKAASDALVMVRQLVD